MQMQIILATGLLCAVGLVNAEFSIATYRDTGILNSFSNANDASIFFTGFPYRVASAISTYETHLTADPQYASVTSAVHSVLATRTDVEPAVTATGTTTTITTQPPWYTALPSDVRSYYSSVEVAEHSVYVAADSAFVSEINAAPHPTATTSTATTPTAVNAAPRPAAAGYGAAAGFVAAGALGVAALLV